MERPPYYHEKERRELGIKEPLRLKFLPAFTNSMEILINKRFFEGCSFMFRHKLYPEILCFSEKQLNKILTIRICPCRWPLDSSTNLKDSDLLSVIEVLHDLLSDLCKDDPIYDSYNDEIQIRIEIYTKQINILFKRFGQPYMLVDGRIARTDSEILDNYVLGFEIPIMDDHLKDLVTKSLKNFYDKSGERKYEGLRFIVDAFERAKTLLDENNKKRSIEMIIKEISIYPELETGYDGLFKHLSKIGNTYGIRHAEHNQIIIKDDITIEFLFYNYFNAVRLILSCLYSEDTGTDDPASDPTDN